MSRCDTCLLDVAEFCDDPGACRHLQFAASPSPPSGGVDRLIREADGHEAERLLVENAKLSVNLKAAMEALEEAHRAMARYIECSQSPDLTPYIKENGRYGTKSPWVELHEARDRAASVHKALKGDPHHE